MFTPPPLQVLVKLAIGCVGHHIISFVLIKDNHLFHPLHNQNDALKTTSGWNLSIKSVIHRNIGAILRWGMKLPCN